jgi:hypothetical protein
MQSDARPSRSPASSDLGVRRNTPGCTIEPGRCSNRRSHPTQYPRFHELAHALVRLDHQDADPNLDYAAGELVAESTAFTCVRSLGIPADQYSIPYLASWAQSADLDTIERTAGLIDRLASRIENTLHSDPTDSIDEEPAGTIGAEELEAVIA